jgi:hypothetical protein
MEFVAVEMEIGTLVLTHVGPAHGGELQGRNDERPEQGTGILPTLPLLIFTMSICPRLLPEGAHDRIANAMDDRTTIARIAEKLHQ